MSFESRIMAFSDRFLSDRAYQLIVVPALADLQFDQEHNRRSRFACAFARGELTLRIVRCWKL